jgi:hypothetical protein
MKGEGGREREDRGDAENDAETERGDGFFAGAQNDTGKACALPVILSNANNPSPSSTGDTLGLSQKSCALPRDCNPGPSYVFFRANQALIMLLATGAAIVALAVPPSTKATTQISGLL